MELYIDENGKARDLDECSVNIVCESKEEAEKMMEGLADGRLVMVEWHPIEVVNDKSSREEEEQIKGSLPEDGQRVLVSVLYARGKHGVAVDTFCNDRDGCYFEDWDWSEVKAWAELPKPYREEEEENDGKH